MSHEETMDLEQFTEKSRKALQVAQGLALRSNHQRFSPEHILSALLSDDDSAPKLVAATGASLAAVQQLTANALKKIPVVEGMGAGQLFLAPETARVLESAKDIAK
jgi:ATP-dependent Clp protease ATP-binding subunit ClpB